MSAFAWRRQSGRPSSPPESSAAGRRSGPDTDSFDPASAHGGVIARAGSAVRGVRAVLAAALLSLPLLAGLATGAAAQTSTVQFSRDTFTIREAATGGQPWQFQGNLGLYTVTGNSPGGTGLTITATDGTAVIGTHYRLFGNDNSRIFYLTTEAPLTISGFYTSANGDDAADKSFTLTMALGTPYRGGSFTLGSRRTATVVIRDNDPTVVSLARVGSGAVTEGDKVEFTVTLGRALVAGEVIDVPLSISGAGVTTGDWSLATKSGSGLNTGVTLRRTSTATPTVRFSGAGAETATLELTPTADGSAEGRELFTVALGNDAAFDAASLGTDIGGGADPHGTDNRLIVGVDDFVGSLVFAPGSVNVVEEASETYTVALDTRPTGPVTVALSRSGDSDVTFSPATLTFNASGTKLWSEPQTVTVSAAMDGDGRNDTATLTHSASGGGYDNVTGDVPVTVTDNSQPSLVFSPPSLSVTEGGSETYTVRLVFAPTGPVTVTLSSNNGDVTFSPASLTFNANGTKLWSDPQTVTVSAGEDGDRVDEPAAIAHTAAGGGYGSVSGTVSVSVVDDDAASCTNCVWVTPDSIAVTEGEKAKFVLRANPAPSKDLKVHVLVADWRSHFLSARDQGIRTFTIPSGVSDFSFELQTRDDTTDERDGAVWVQARSTGDDDYRVRRGSGQYGLYTRAQVTVRDNDNPPPPETVRPEVSFSQANSFVEEGDSVSLTVNLVPAPASQITLGYRLDDRSKARAGSDYTRPSGTVTVPAGTSAVTIEVQTTDDSSHEGSEELVLRLSKGAGYRVKKGATDRHMLIIEDNDGGGTFSGTPVVYFGSMSSTVVENSGRAATHITVTPAPTSQLTVNLAMSGGSATAGSDYTNLTSIAVPAGRSVVVIDNILDDSVTEGDESFTIALQAGTGYRVYDPGAGSTLRRHRHTVHIVDDETDRAKIVSHTLSQTTIEEDAADPWVDVDIRLSEEHSPAVPGVLGLPLDFGVCFSGSARRSNSMSKTGANGYDYRVWGKDRNGNDVILTTACPSGRFEPGETQVRMRIEILDDSHEDSGETIRVGMLRDDVERWRSFGVLLRAPLQTLVVLNDETTALLAGHPVMKYAALVKSFYDRIGADHEHGDGPSGGWNKRFLKAMGHPEYVDYPQAAVTVADATRLWNHRGPGSNAAWDGTVEAVTYAEQYFAGQTTTPDPASGPEVTIAAGDGVTEGTSATFTLTADPAPAAPLDVSVTVATDGDYGIAAGTQTVTIPATGSATLTLATAGDEADETDGSVSVTVDAGDGYTVGSASSGSVAIADDDDTPTGAHPAVDPALIAQIREWMAAPGANVAVRNERFTRVLAAFGVESHANPMTVAEAEGYVRRGWGGRWQPIVDALKAIEAYVAPPPDPTPEPTADPEVTIAAGSGVTEGTAATFTLTASPAPTAPLDVTVTVAAEGDYGITAGTQTVTIPTAGSATLTLATTGDEVDEADGSVSVTVDAGSGYTVGAASSGSVAIADDDLPPPVVSVAAKAASIAEGGDAVFTVKADRTVDADLAVTLTVSEKANSDFVAAADEGGKTVTILDGETEATLTVKTVDDAVDEPDGSVTATVDAGAGYTVAPSPADAASVAVADNDAAGLPTISVEDVTVREGGTAVIPVRLAPAPTKPVRLFYKTMGAPVGSEGYASWSDFKSARASLNFRPGETLKYIRIKTVQDSHDDGGEWFEVLVKPAGGHAVPAAGVYATVTIENDDPMPGAYLARFGRTVAEQALDGIAGRMSADRTPGMQGTVAGQALNFDPSASEQAAGATPGASGATPADRGAVLAMTDIARGLGADATAPISASAGPGSATDRFGAGFGDNGFGSPSLQSRTMTARDALLGSSFSLTGQKDGAGGSLAFWGRVSQGSFDGAERGDGTDIRLDGTVTTGMLGADYARGNWLIGLALTQSTSEGSYAAIGGENGGDGDVEASLTAAIPYAALQASERLKLWGAAGYGTGEVTLKTAPGSGSGAGSGEKLSADTRWTMAAAGVRGELLTPPEEGGGPALALTSDALWARTSSDKTGELAATDSDVTRLRLGLEGSYRIAMESLSRAGRGNGASLVPKLEVGARHDGGDAETGFGVEVGGGIAWVDPSLGLSIDVSGRTLLAHENDDLKDRGFSAALGFDPAPATGRGPSFSLRQDFGGQASGGLDALFVNDPLEDRAGSEATSRWAMEAAYGLPVFRDRFTGSPHVGLGLSTGSRDYSLGWHLTPEAATAPDLSFGVKATRRESDAAEAEHTVGFEVRARW